MSSQRFTRIALAHSAFECAKGSSRTLLLWPVLFKQVLCRLVGFIAAFQRRRSTCSHRAPTGIRNRRAILTVLNRGGLRLDEPLKLRPKELDVERGTIQVLRGKRDKPRVVGLDEGALPIIQRWLDKRSALQRTVGDEFMPHSSCGW